MMDQAKRQEAVLCPTCGLTMASHWITGETVQCPRTPPVDMQPHTAAPPLPLEPFPPPADSRFRAILAELAALEARKRADYGRDGDPLANIRASTEWDLPPWVGAMLRLTDKVRRLQTFYRQGKLANEGAVDSLNDIAVYAILARMLLEEQGHAKP